MVSVQGVYASSDNLVAKMRALLFMNEQKNTPAILKLIVRA
jgi:hypothetical protein